ncbi:hypothetical protein RA210_U30288 [Rubrivivax sp. A210]|nr:hypothetical protein RA210_U30288 [Rubrivivax sp. A210]
MALLGPDIAYYQGAVLDLHLPVALRIPDTVLSARNSNGELHAWIEFAFLASGSGSGGAHGFGIRAGRTHLRGYRIAARRLLRHRQCQWQLDHRHHQQCGSGAADQGSRHPGHHRWLQRRLPRQSWLVQPDLRRQ